MRIFELKLTKPILAIFCFAVCLALTSSARGEKILAQTGSELMEFTLEELMEVEVTSVSKKKEKLFETPSAVYVITSEDIRRSGAVTFAEVLRLAPGVQVAHLDGNAWAVTARGFNSLFASKLLVMIDGRSVYSTLFSGVFWDELNIMMEDVERIEVVRGPGGTVWGANAVNGVVNIITKHSRDTQGGLVTAGGGKEERGFGSFRYGEEVNSDLHLRAYGKYFDRDASAERLGKSAEDEWAIFSGGARMDWNFSARNKLMIEGNHYNGESSERADANVVSFTAPFTDSFDRDLQINGSDFLIRWEHEFSADSDMALQFFFNQQHRNNTAAPDILIDTYDVDFQHRFSPAKRHEVIWGLGQRFVNDSLEEGFNVKFSDVSRLNYIFSAFLQDDIELVPEKLHLILGSKFGENNYTGFEYQPSARLSWTPNSDHTVWGAVSRAIRLPSRSEDTIRINTSAVASPLGTAVVGQFGQGSFESEDLLALELGYRRRVNDKFFFDLATFYNFYDDLISREPESLFFEASPGPLHAVFPLSAGNAGNAETYGIELAAQWTPTAWWKLNAGFSWFQMDFDVDAGSGDTFSSVIEGNDPEFQAQLRSYVDLPYDLEFDTALYFVDELESSSVQRYTRVDLRLGWRPLENLDFSAVVQNLQEDEHAEFGPESLQFFSPTKIQRTIYGKITWRF